MMSLYGIQIEIMNGHALKHLIKSSRIHTTSIRSYHSNFVLLGSTNKNVYKADRHQRIKMQKYCNLMSKSKLKMRTTRNESTAPTLKPSTTNDAPMLPNIKSQGRFGSTQTNKSLINNHIMVNHNKSGSQPGDMSKYLPILSKRK